MFDLKQRWRQDWARLGLAGDACVLEHLVDSHGASGRYYHTLQHLRECLALFDQVAILAERPGEVAIALWFHDALYVAQAGDNEARSAAWAGEALQGAGAGQDVIARVQALIMATAHHEVPEDPDTRLLIDIDLAILGAEPERFVQYEQQVRAEYAAVADSVYRRKRTDLLARFLARPAIYSTRELHARFEARARENLRHATGQPATAANP